jgi:hypothetical protein
MMLDSDVGSPVVVMHGFQSSREIWLLEESDSLELINYCNGIIDIWTPYTAICRLFSDCSSGWFSFAPPLS